MKISLPRVLLHLEGLVALSGACLLYSKSGNSWALFALTLLLPDLSAAGYLGGPRAGALLYNLAHTYTTPLLLGVVFHLTGRDNWQWMVLVWIAHVGLDRTVGYGLKYSSGPKPTHLDRV